MGATTPETMLYFASESPVLLSPYLDISGCVRACVSPDHSADGGRVPVCENSRRRPLITEKLTQPREVLWSPYPALGWFLNTAHRFRHHFIQETSGVSVNCKDLHPL